jgi:hypothetical protein
MKLPRVRISTLMLLVAIVALVVALVVERRRSARLVAQMQAERDNARMTEVVTIYYENMAKAAAAVNQPVSKAEASEAKPTDPSR